MKEAEDQAGKLRAQLQAERKTREKRAKDLDGIRIRAAEDGMTARKARDRALEEQALVMANLRKQQSTARELQNSMQTEAAKARADAELREAERADEKVCIKVYSRLEYSKKSIRCGIILPSCFLRSVSSVIGY